MKLIKPSFEIIEQEPGLDGVYKQIELAGRTCYKSEDKITENSAKEFVDRMIKSGHGAMLEHGTVYLEAKDKDLADKYSTNRYSFVRHRVFSFAQESTRYCNYSKDKYNNCVTFILPNWCTNVNVDDYKRNPKLMYNANGTLTDNEINFLCGLYDSESRHLKLLENGWTPQQARAILPKIKG